MAEIQGIKFIAYKDFIRKIEDYFAPRKVEVEFYDDDSGIDFIKIATDDIMIFEAFSYETNPSLADLLNEIFPLGDDQKIENACRWGDGYFIPSKKSYKKEEEIRQKFNLPDDDPYWAKLSQEASNEWLAWIKGNNVVSFEVEKKNNPECIKE